MAVSRLTQRGYDPDAMSWTTVPMTEEPNSAIPSNIRSQALLNAAARRLQEKAKMVAPAAAPASGNPAGKTQPPASHAAGCKGKVFTKWKPRPLLKPNPDEYVIVVKPREHISLHEAFSENRYGTAFTAYLGSERAETASILPSREQNLIVIHTPDLETADRVIGDSSVNTERGAVPLHGYLLQDGGNVCHGVIVVCNSDTTETLQQKLRWRAGTIVEVRKFGTSNKACVTFAGKDKPRFVHYDNMVLPVLPYYRTIPACGKCGAVGHRMDACPNLRQDTCGLCGQQIPLVEGVRAPHECVPKCSVCGGGHDTNSRECTAKFRNSKITAQKGGKTITAVKKKHRHLELPGRSPHRDVTKTGKPAPPAGEAGRQSTAPPHGVAGAWADAVKKGKQWNCRGFKAHAKRANLRFFLTTFEHLPAGVALQEPGSGATLTNYTTFQQDPLSCICVHKNYTANFVDLDLKTEFSYVMVTLLPLRKQDPPLHVLNIYCSPKLANITFADLFSRALKAAGRDPLVIVGNFNALSTLWGYAREEKRGRKLAELMSTLGLTLHTDPAHPTRVGNSVTRGTCPDLTLTKNIQYGDWVNTEETLGSDHCILNTTIRTHPLARPFAQAKLPDWTKFRQTYTNSTPIQEQGYHVWSQQLVSTLRYTETQIQLSEATPEVDNHLLHLLEARHSLVRRWRRQKHNRKL
nr:uncharacterized protein LOC126526123 [Dermacentor andersoni]